MEILIKRLRAEAKLPDYKNDVSSGIAVFAVEGVTIEPGQKAEVSTGIAMAVPVGYVGVISSKDCCDMGGPIKVSSSILCSSYRDEIKVEVSNVGQAPVTFAAGDKVTEMLVQKVERPMLIEAEELS